MSTYQKPPPGRSRPPSAPRRDGKPRAPAEPRKATDGDAGRTEGERIARRLARVGLASRREAEAMIAAGRVSVNGKLLSSPAVNVSAADVILVDGQPLPPVERTRLFLFHKPAGTMTTNRDPEGRPTVFDVLPKNLPRLMTVGRLDFATEGLLLFTNDGGLARLLELPSTGWLRRYRVRVHGTVDQAMLDRLKEGIAVDGILYGAIDAILDRVQGSNAWLTLSLREGKNREVRNVLGALGLEVTRLIRVSYGPFQLGELPEGAVMELKGRTLRDQLGPRLIAAAGADFDAEIRQPFSNAPAPAPAEPARSGPERKSSPRPRAAARVGRDEALQRLDTKPGKREGKREGARTVAPGKPGRPPKRGTAGPGAAEKAEGQHSRTANVWRAPGARPLGPEKLKKKKSTEARDERRGKDRPKPTGRPRGGHADRRR